MYVHPPFAPFECISPKMERGVEAFYVCFVVVVIVLVVKYRRVKESLKKREFERARCMYTDKE